MTMAEKNYDDTLEICRDEYEDLIKMQGQVDALMRVVQSDDSTFISKSMVAAIMNFYIIPETEPDR